MIELAGKRALVTGAASGIGRATALALAARGAALELVDVDEVRLADTRRELERLARATVACSHLDVADAAAVQSLAELLHADGRAIDVLVNNAGVALAAEFGDTELEDWRWILGVNLWGPIHFVRAFLPQMLLRGTRAHVVNVASAAAFLNLPSLAAYGTSKHALLGLSEALREELRPHGIRVTCVCPAFVNTPLADHARLRGLYAREPERARAPLVQSRLSPEFVANAIVGVLGKDVGVLPVGRDARLLRWLKRLAPEALPRLITRWSARP